MLVDIGDHKRAETRLAERNAQLDLAGTIARIGSFAYDHATQKLQLSPGCAAIYGLPEGTVEVSREDWRALVHPDDLRPLDAVTRRAFANCETELILEFRILRHDEVRWIESRVLILYNEVGRAFRRIGAQVDITDRKRAELALAERNTQLELASETARVGSLAIDLSTALVDLSPGCAMILGLPEGTLETSRDNARKLIHPQDIAQLDAARDQALRKKEREFVTQCRILRADDGEVRWLEVRCLIFYGRGGEPLRLIAVIIDLTDRKRAEDTLHQRETELVEAQRLARIGSWHWDAVSDVTVGSEELLRIFGLDPGTRGLPAYREQRGRWFPVDDWKRLKAAMQSTIQTGVSYEVELQAFRTGTPIWITARGAVVLNSRNQIVGLRGTVQEITDRKLAELALAERNRQLDLAEKAALVGSYAYDLDTKVVRVSEGYAALHGLPAKRPITTGHKWRASTHPEDVIRIEKVWNQAFRARRGEYEIEYRIVRDGKVRWIYSRSFISYGSDGRAHQVVGVNIDITERKRAEERQRLLVAELDHRVKNALATVSAIAAHTLDGSNSMEHFVAALDGRIRSMASSHELLSCRRWEGIPLAELFQRELTPYTRGNNTEVDGPAVLLRAEAGQSMAFVLHELTTNAAKYGALSTSEGRITVRWHWPPNGAARERLIIEWQEIGGPAVAAPRKSGYGTSVIRNLIPHELGGKADLAITPEGARCRMEIPGHWVARETAPIDGLSPATLDA